MIRPGKSFTGAKKTINVWTYHQAQKGKTPGRMLLRRGSRRRYCAADRRKLGCRLVEDRTAPVPSRHSSSEPINVNHRFCFLGELVNCSEDLGTHGAVAFGSFRRHRRCRRQSSEAKQRQDTHRAFSYGIYVYRVCR